MSANRTEQRKAAEPNDEYDFNVEVTFGKENVRPWWATMSDKNGGPGDEARSDVKDGS
jgi:hypothetical protein